ncbi:ROK family protein, partial [Enterococcus faecalis]
EASGSALLRKMNQLLKNGETSVLTEKVMKQHQPLTLQDILDAIGKEDVLSIEALQKMAVELGTNLAGIINIFNPKMLV